MSRREAPLDPARGSGVRRPPDTKKDRECRGLGLRRWPASAAEMVALSPRLVNRM